MQSEIFRIICQMGIFIICAQSIVHFRPRAVYEKYLKMLVSVMILIQLFLPVGSFFSGRNAEEFSNRVEKFENSFALGRKEAEENAVQSRKLLEQMTLEEVRTRLESGASGAGNSSAPAGSSSALAGVPPAPAEAETEGELQPVEIEPVEQIAVEIGEQAGT